VVETGTPGKTGAYSETLIFAIGPNGQLLAGMNCKEGFVLQSYPKLEGGLGLRPIVYQWTKQLVLVVKFPKELCLSKAKLGLAPGVTEVVWKNEAIVAVESLSGPLKAGILLTLDSAFPGKQAPAIHFQVSNQSWNLTARTDAETGEGKVRDNRPRMELRGIIVANCDMSRDQMRGAISDKDRTLAGLHPAVRARAAVFLQDADWTVLHYSREEWSGFMYMYPTRSAPDAKDGEDAVFVRPDTLTTFQRVARCVCVSVCGVVCVCERESARARTRARSS